MLDELVSIVRQSGDSSQADRLKDKPKAASDESGSNTPVRCVSPITSSLPRSWYTINIGHMVLVHESSNDVISRWRPA